MNVSSISNSNLNNMYKLYAKLSSAKKINSAADDAAGLAISRKMQTQSTSYQTANRNISDSQSLLNTADGSMGSVTDSLQRIKELAVQGSNGTYSASDKQMMQDEIDQLKDHINSVSQGTQYNGISILNGTNMQLSGTSQQQSFNVSTDSLGITDFDITGSFDIGAIDSAINTVSSIRGGAGGISNAMTHTIGSNEIADINIQSAQSRIEDADMARTIMELKKSQLLNKSNIYVQSHRQQQMAGMLGQFVNVLA